MTSWIDASPHEPQLLTAAVLAEWYASRSVVRRLWAVDGVEAIRIVLVLEPTVDGDDTQPAWLANSSAWTDELELLTHRAVRVQLLKELSHITSPLASGDVLIADIAWRDPVAWID